MSDGRQANPDAPVVRLRDVTKAYQLEGRPLQVLRGITLDVAAGQIVAITGSSGAGKSTLLHIVGALDKATSGHVEVRGERLGEMKAGELADFRNGNIGFVFQFHHLLPEFTAAENVAMPLLIRGVGMRQALRQADEYLAMVGLALAMAAAAKAAAATGGVASAMTAK